MCCFFFTYVIVYVSMHARDVQLRRRAPKENEHACIVKNRKEVELFSSKNGRRDVSEIVCSIRFQ